MVLRNHRMFTHHSLPMFVAILHTIEIGTTIPYIPIQYVSYSHVVLITAIDRQRVLGPFVVLDTAR